MQIMTNYLSNDIIVKIWLVVDAAAFWRKCAVDKCGLDKFAMDND
jgi:hypothetical protein